LDLSAHIIDIVLPGIVLVIAVILLLYWVLSFIFNKKFRDSLDSIGDDVVPMTRQQYRDNTLRELYAIWIGRMLEIMPAVSGTGKKGIGWEHLISVIAWLLILTGIGGLFSNWYRQDFWATFILFTLFVSYLYAEWKAAYIIPAA
jgi:hypothetical protein